MELKQLREEDKLTPDLVFRDHTIYHKLSYELIAGEAFC
jgi:hypothetical protein